MLQIFGPEIIVPLSDLLPKTSELDKPPMLKYTSVDDYKIYCEAIGVFILKIPLAVQISVENIVNIVEKIIPFIVYNKEKKFQDLVFKTLVKICEYDKLSVGTLSNYLNQYGSVRHDLLNTTLNDELKSYHQKDLYDLVQKKSEGLVNY